VGQRQGQWAGSWTGH